MIFGRTNEMIEVGMSSEECTAIQREFPGINAPQILEVYQAQAEVTVSLEDEDTLTPRPTGETIRIEVSPVMREVLKAIVGVKHQARQLYVRHDDWHKFCGGYAITAYTDHAGNPDGYKQINVVGDEILADYGRCLTIEKHY